MIGMLRTAAFNQEQPDPLGMETRRSTLQKVLTGEMMPAERRLQIVQRRAGLATGFGNSGTPLGNSTDLNISTLDTEDNVEVAATGTPSDAHVQAVNAVAQANPDKIVRLEEDGSIEVGVGDQDGDSFSGESGEENELEDASTQSMSEVAEDLLQ